MREAHSPSAFRLSVSLRVFLGYTESRAGSFNLCASLFVRLVLTCRDVSLRFFRGIRILLLVVLEAERCSGCCSEDEPPPSVGGA